MKDLLGFTEIATLAGIKPASVARYHQHGQMPPPDYTVSRVPMWKRATVERWLASRRAPGRPAGSKNKPKLADIIRLPTSSTVPVVIPSDTPLTEFQTIVNGEFGTANSTEPVLMETPMTYYAVEDVVWACPNCGEAGDPGHHWLDQPGVVTGYVCFGQDSASSTEPVVCTTPCGRCLPTSTETGVKRCRWEGAEYVEP